MKAITTVMPILVGLCAFACGAGSPSYESIVEKHQENTYRARYLVTYHSTGKDDVTTEWRETFKQGDRFRDDWLDQDRAYTTIDVGKDFNVVCHWSEAELQDIDLNSKDTTCKKVDRPGAFSGLPRYRAGTLINYDAIEGYAEVAGRTVLGESVRCFRSTSDNLKRGDCFTKDAWLAYARTETRVSHGTETFSGVETMEALELSHEVPEDAFVLPTYLAP